tara:strand:+ start:581 stop:703 length:123 start_codon:yes stop_codon:yes gene_type:complete
MSGFQGFFSNKNAMMRGNLLIFIRILQARPKICIFAMPMP